MGEKTTQFLQGLPACAAVALAAAAATLVFGAAADYLTYYAAVKFYSVGWFITCLLSFYCGLLVVPRSPGILFSFAGVVAFAVVCAMDAAALAQRPLASFIIQSLPAWLFLLAWASITLSTVRSETKKIRLSGWLWLTILLMLTASWGAFHLAQRQLLNQRNRHLIEAHAKTLLLVEHLEVYRQDTGAYPETLAATGWPEAMRQLSYREKGIKYFGHGDTFVLTFDDPMLCRQKAFSYDTSQDGWYPQDPEEALKDRIPHLFLGALRQW
jgi:hypothetical protein